MVAFVRRMVSDISGAEAPERDFLTLVVRQHPSVDEPKALDVLPSEVDALRAAGDVVVLEVKGRAGTTRIFVTLPVFRTFVGDEVVQRARGTRGRRPGARISASRRDPYKGSN
jgi:hypothetical protein